MNKVLQKTQRSTRTALEHVKLVVEKWEQGCRPGGQEGEMVKAPGPWAVTQ